MIEEEDDHVAGDPPAGSPAHQAKEPVGAELLDKALANLKAMVRGNGLNPESITRRKFSGEVLNFEAFEVFKIEHSVAERHSTGRENGERLGSRQDAHQKIQAAIDRMGRDREVQKLTTNLLKKRPDVGYGIDGQVIPLKRYNKAWVVHEPCGPCDATGKTQCQNCRGKRMIMCVKCHGQRDIQCTVCAGTQFINTAQGRQQCTRCYGKGRIDCDMCRQSGEVPCPKCRNSGKMACNSCGATGWHSTTYQMDVKAKSHFTYDRDALPPEVPPLIDEYGPRLVTEGHGRARIIEDLRRAQELDKISKSDEYIIPYHVALPWGDIEFAVKDKTLAGKLFGYNALLIGLPAFLGKVMAGGLRLVSEAAAGKGNVSAKIGKAVRYRAIGEAFFAAGQYAPKRAAVLMQTKYPSGFSAEELEKLTRDARLAMKNVAKKPRLYGLAAGAAGACILYAAWFVGPLRAMIANAGAQVPEIVPDFAVMALGGILVTAGAQIGAANALKQALGKLLQKSGEKTSKILPSALTTALIGFPLALALFALVLYASIMAGHPAPGWYLNIVSGHR